MITKDRVTGNTLMSEPQTLRARPRPERAQGLRRNARETFSNQSRSRSPASVTATRSAHALRLPIAARGSGQVIPPVGTRSM
jgi:hypothetical protein